MTERRDKGLYWDRAWKLVEGCTKVSAGCDNCWSETETAMRAFHPNDKISRRAVDLIEEHPDCDRLFFNGDILLRHDNLDLPLRVKKPTVFAVWNDLFHEDVPDGFRDRAYAVMALCPQHTFLALTKRAERMAEYWQDKITNARIRHHILTTYRDRFDTYKAQICVLQNVVWHGVTAENQQTADERIPHLLRVPGKRFLSIEPMLSQITLPKLCDNLACGDYGPGPCDPDDCSSRHIHAVLLGGESGKNARPMHPDWARSVRDQCAAAGVPFFFKQWGEWLPGEATPDSGTAYRRCDDGSIFGVRGKLPARQNFGTHLDLHSGPMITLRVGKRAAGRLLDGVLHDHLPW